MKVCTISLSRPDLTNRGTERAAWCYSRELAKLGCEIHIFYPSSYTQEDFVENVWLRGVSNKASNPVLRRMAFFRNCRKEVIHNDLKIGFDLISFYGPISLPLMPLIKKLGKPLIFHCAATAMGEVRTSAYLAELIHSFPSSIPIIGHYAEAIFYELAFLNCADAIIMAMEENMENFKHLRHKLDANFYVVPYGQDIYDQFYLKVRKNVESFKRKFDGKKILLFIGGTNWCRKGCRNLLYAFKEVIKKVPSVLIIIGTAQEPYLSLIKNLNLKIDEDIIVTGLVTDEVLTLLYASCDVFTLPSLHEAFSQTVLEAMAFGKPVIVSPIASYLVENGVEGYIIDPSDVNSYAEGLVTLLSDDKQYNVMSRNAREEASLYSWKNVGWRLYETYEKILLARR